MIMKGESMKEIKVAILLVGVVSTWAILLVPAAWAAITPFDVTSSIPSSYTNCLASLRKDAKDPNLIYFGIPMLPALSPTPNPKYLLVDLNSGTDTITLAIRRQDLYILGYADKVNGNTARAHFFQDTPDDAKKDLFKEATIRVGISFKSSYPSIEGVAGVKDRAKFGLGVQKLASRFSKVYGADVSKKDVQKNQAEMFLIAIQMLSEAARFTYIENKVKANFAMFEFLPDAKFIRLENRWDKLSTAIRGANPTTKKFPKSVDLVNPNGTPFTATNVDDVKPDMALLKYVK